MSDKLLRSQIAIDNLCWWLMNTGGTMPAKWCKLTGGWVQLNYDCEGCTMCGGDNGSTTSA